MIPLVALPLGRVCGKCHDAARLHYQCSEKTWSQGGQVLVSAGCVVPSWTHSWNTERLAALPCPHEETVHMFTSSWVG